MNLLIISLPKVNWLKKVRTQLYGITYNQYATYIMLSDKTLHDIEKVNAESRFQVFKIALVWSGFKLCARAVRPEN